jgi:hypothetical protein
MDSWDLTPDQLERLLTILNSDMGKSFSHICSIVLKILPKNLPLIDIPSDQIHES